MAAWKGPSGASTRRAWDERIAGQWERPRVLTWHHPRASSLKMLGLSLWEGRLPGQKTIENEDKAAMGSYRPESNFGTSDTVRARYERNFLRSLCGATSADCTMTRTHIPAPRRCTHAPRQASKSPPYTVGVQDINHVRQSSSSLGRSASGKSTSHLRPPDASSPPRSGRLFKQQRWPP